MLTQEAILKCAERDDYCSTEKELAMSHLEANGEIEKLNKTVKDLSSGIIPKLFDKFLERDKLDAEIDRLKAEVERLKGIIVVIRDKHSVEHRHRHNEFPSTTSLCEQALADDEKEDNGLS